MGENDEPPSSSKFQEEDETEKSSTRESESTNNDEEKLTGSSPHRLQGEVPLSTSQSSSHVELFGKLNDDGVTPDQFQAGTDFLLPLGHRIFQHAPLPNTLILPSNWYYRIWKFWIYFLVVCSSFIWPFQMAFFKELQLPLTIVSIFVNVFLLVDLVVSFYVPYTDSSTRFWVYDKYMIARHHLRRKTTWFSLCQVMFWELIPGAKRFSGLIRTICLVALVLRVRHCFTRWEKNTRIKFDVIHCFWVLYITLCIVSCSGCSLYFIATISDRNFMDQYRSRTIWERYVTSIYWSMTTFTTVGYGDWRPITTAEKSFTFVFMLVNIGLFAYITGSISVILNDACVKIKDHSIKLQAISRFAKRHQLSCDLEKEMMVHLCIRHRTDFEGLELQDLLKPLPLSLQCEIKRKIFMPILEGVVLFHDTPHAFLSQLATVVEAEYYEKDETVIFQDEEPTAMYVLVNGLMKVDKVKNGVLKIENIKPGETCGEIGVLCDIHQPFAVRTRSRCQLLRIRRKKFLKIYQANIWSGAMVMRRLFEDLRVQNFTNLMERAEKIFGYGLNSFLTLHFAVFECNMDLLVQLLECGANPNQTDEEGRIALHVAVSNGDVVSVKHLIRQGADCSRKDQSGISPLWMAMEEDNSKIIDAIMRHGKLTSKHVDRFACVAVDYDRIDFLEKLHHYKFEYLATEYEETTALHKAVLKGNVDMVKWLTRCGYCPHAQDIKGESSLKLAKENLDLVISMFDGYKMFKEDDFKLEVGTNDSKDDFKFEVHLSPRSAKSI